ncbi:TonB-dependent receptor [Salegentibacter sp. BLCTC]|uniref:TonB-dependent receptor n=1 Tax=Salegentibacter sp. BLCTC TaxID=2697368 RepID=UPI001D11DD83|nr:TonB-dependent receptor [Salegentibacter sp. BLCTC]
MKLTTLLLIISLFKIHANTYSQDKKITLEVQNATIKEVFREIEDLSEFRFLYNQNKVDVNRKVSLNAYKKPISDILDSLFSETDIYFKVKKKQIILKEGKPKEKLIPGTSNVMQETITVTGTVTEAETGMPIPAANILEKGTSNGVMSDFDGNFSIKVSADAILQISYIGYATKEVNVNDRNEIDIVLEEDAAALEEVVVVGYGTQRKGSVIGAVSQLNSKNIEDRTVPNITQSLTGQMPGVTVIQRSGRPGSSGGELSIRGVGSFGANANPLVLIDGIPGDLSQVNSNDVESVSVLKDAAAAAIYGSRAANGVVLVTTKNGKKGKLDVKYQGYVGFQQATQLPEMVDSWEYAELYNEAIGDDVYTSEDIQKFKQGNDLDNYPNSKFVESVFKRNPIQTSHNFQINGGSEATRYLVSLGYLNQKGLLEDNNYSRYNLRLNLINEINEKLTLTTRLSGTQEITEEPAPPGGIEFDNMMAIINEAVRVPAIYAGQFSDGDFGTGHAQMGTPLSFIESESFYTNKPFNFNANMKLDWNILKSLKLSLIGGYEKNTRKSKRFLASQRLNANLLLGPASLRQIYDESSYRTIQGIMEFDKKFGDHDIEILAGYSFEDNHYEIMNGFRDKLPSNNLHEINVGSPEGQQINGTANEWALQSFFGRAKYEFRKKYLFESTMRYDGSSRFPKNKKYAFFPSFAIGWKLSEERFFTDALPWIDDFKLKASYGKLGNQNIGNYPYQTVFSSGYDYPFGGSLHPGVAITNITDSNLHWESTTSHNVGGDFTLLNNNLDFSINYFIKKTTDILYKPSSSISSILGKEISETNTGSLRNEGWEFMMSYNKSWNDFRISLSPNFSIIHNKVQDLGVGNIQQPNGLVGNGNDLFIGYPMNIYYGYVADGLYRDDDAIANGADVSKINPQPKPGDIKYKDISGPDGVPDGQVDAKYDRKILGSRIPKYTFGFNLGANYKNFDFNVLFQGVGGVKGRLSGYAGTAFYNTASIQRWMKENRWTLENPNPNASYPRLEIVSNQGTPNTLESSYWILNASYLRLKNVRIGYKLPSELLNKWKVKNIRFYLSGENIITWDKYPQGWDPEINSGGQFYPILSNYTLGVTINI